VAIISGLGGNKMARQITLSQAKKLKHGQTLYHLVFKNADGTAQRWRVNGKVKTWKTQPERVQVPIKHGLYSYDYLTENELHLVSLTEPKPRMPKRLLRGI
jgi:hypothetical protein